MKTIISNKITILLLSLFFIYSCQKKDTYAPASKREIGNHNNTTSSPTKVNKTKEDRKFTYPEKTNTIEYKYAIALSGLNYRKKPKGKIIGKLNFGERVKIVEHSNVFETIKDNYKLVKGEWVGIKINTDIFYVFDGFLSGNKDYESYCHDKTIYHPEYPDSIIISTCRFRDYIVKSEGTPNYKGQYSWESGLFKINNKDSIRISNYDLFNDNVGHLEKIINARLKTEYETNLKDPDLSNCLSSIDFRFYELNVFDISFEDNQITFSIDYNLINYCNSVSVSYISFKFEEIEEYLD